MLKKFLAIILLGVFTSACAANHAAFISEPAGAEVYVDGELIGTTPCQLDYFCDSGSHYQITIQKEGFVPVSHMLKADEVDREARNTWLTAGVIWSPLWLGTLFTKKLKESYEFVLKGLSPEQTAKNENPGPGSF